MIYSLPEIVQNLSALQPGKRPVCDLAGRLLYTGGWRYILLSVISNSTDEKIEAIRAKTITGLQELIRSDSFPKEPFLKIYYYELKKLGYRYKALKQKIRGELAVEEIRKCGVWPIPEGGEAEWVKSVYNFSAATLYYALQATSPGQEEESITRLALARLPTLFQASLPPTKRQDGREIEGDYFVFGKEHLFRYSQFPFRPLIEAATYDGSYPLLMRKGWKHPFGITVYESVQSLTEAQKEQLSRDELNVENYVSYNGQIYCLGLIKLNPGD